MGYIMEFHTSLAITRLLVTPLLLQPKSEDLLSDDTYICHWTRRSQADPKLLVSPLLTSVHDAGSYRLPEAK